LAFEVYIALGDSMTLDDYPASDADRLGLEGRRDIGAASLFYKNDETLFPEHAGKDLASTHPHLEFANLAYDDATVDNMLNEDRLNALNKYSTAHCLVSLTIGGNDLLKIFKDTPNNNSNILNSATQEVHTRYLQLLKLIKATVPASTILLTTLYDPTDGTGILPSTTMGTGELPVKFIEQFNGFIESCAKRQKEALADVYSHFRGHGAECGHKDNFWYCPLQPIEPNYKGASEIRHVWWQTLEADRQMQRA
jgi:lysophospholipase L1-like esterase